MLISSKLNKLTRAKRQQPSLCMLLIYFQFMKLLRLNHNLFAFFYRRFVHVTSGQIQAVTEINLIMPCCKLNHITTQIK